ncbi:MAG TPA: hypothetical protein VG268_16195 [Streptosporangiaceae bacterium]|jgi:hypothetical protein|nr:hypothetical protein [Streptosporangiaceae bacterium]
MNKRLAESNPLDAAGSIRLTRTGTVALHLPAELVQTFSPDGPPGQDSGTHDCKLLTLPAPAGWACCWPWPARPCCWPGGRRPRSPSGDGAA